MNKEIKDIDTFFDEHLDDFDQAEPSFGHFNRFAQKLNQLHEDSDKVTPTPKKWSIKRIASYASVAALFVMATTFGVQFLQTNSDNISSTQQIEQIDQRLADTFRSNIKASSTNQMNNQLSSAMEQVNQLEMEYLNLKFQYSKSNDSNILAAIKNNLSTRASILDEFESIQQDIPSQATRNVNTFVLATDCCGFDSEFSPQTADELFGKIQANY